MATPGKPLDDAAKKRIERLTQVGVSRRAVAKLEEISKTTAQKYCRGAIEQLRESVVQKNEESGTAVQA